MATETNDTPKDKQETSAETTETPKTVESPKSTAPVTAKSSAVTEDPGKTLAIIGIIAPFIGLALVGLILAIIANSKSKKAGFKNTLAKIGIIINIVFIFIAFIAVTISIFVAVAAVNTLKAPVAASNTFTSSLANGDLAKAYSEASSELKAKYPTQAEFSTEYDSSGIGLKFGSVTSKNINTENGLTTATVVYDADVQGQKYTMTVKLVKENGQWLVLSISPAKK
jgi:uncharacterized iron-regulated membrane protein